MSNSQIVHKTLKPNKKFVRHIIKHYLKYDKENPFIFISAILAFLGIATGVMVLMIAMGMMNGTQKEFSKKLLIEADVAVAPGIGFGEYGENYVRIALIENDNRIRQAARNIKKFLKQYES